MPTTARGGIGQKMPGKPRSESVRFGEQLALVLEQQGPESWAHPDVPLRVVVVMHREPIRYAGRLVLGRTRIVKSWNTLGKAGNAVRQLSLAAARLAYYRRKDTKSGEPCRIQVQAWMADGRRIVVIEDHSTRGIIQWEPGELFAGVESSAVGM